MTMRLAPLLAVGALVAALDHAATGRVARTETETVRDSAVPTPVSAPARPMEQDGCGDLIATAEKAPSPPERSANELHEAAARIVTRPACAERVRAWLAMTSCTPAAGVIASAAFASEGWTPRWTSELLGSAHRQAREGDDTCLRTLLPQAQSAAAVSSDLATNVAAIARDPAVARGEAAWLVLGTLGRRARLNEQTELAEMIERSIAAELRSKSARDQDAFDLLEAAGNVGCSSCALEIARALKSDRASTRRVALGAHRFIETSNAVTAMCRGLRGDGDPIVRAHAAWALGWSRAALERRTRCLRTAAEQDPSEDVRAEARRALIDLDPREPSGELAL